MIRRNRVELFLSVTLTLTNAMLVVYLWMDNHQPAC
jgi:hypothetical protein